MKILIDIHSIVENPDAGKTETYIPGVTRCFISGDKIPLKYENDSRLHFEQKEFFLGQNYFSGRGQILIEITKEMVDELRSHLVISMERHIETVRHLPTPKYSYTYIEKSITCPSCKTICITSDLDSVLIYDDDGFESGCDFDCCPNCSTSLNVEYETIEQALLRKKGVEK